MNSYQQAVENIVLIEQSFDVNSICYKDISIWPLIRLALWSQLMHPEINYTRKGLKSNHVIPVFNVDEERLQLLYPGKKTDFIFFSRHEEHHDQFEEKYYNRILDPMIDLVKGHFNYIKIELASNEIKKTLPRYEPPFFFSPKSVNYKKDETLSIKGFDGLQQVVQNVSKIQIDEAVFLEQARHVKAWQVYFKQFLSALRPRILFLVCYYYSIAMALVNACRSLKITTVDVQHGKQGKYHGLYTHWTNIPEDGYDLLPDFFWTWGMETANNIKKWQPVGCRYHLPVIGGNRWLAEWLEGNEFGIDKKEQEFCEFLEQSEKVILVSLQPLDKPLSGHLLDAMKASPKNWLWLIRLHPLYKYQKKDLQTLIIQKGIANYEIDFATDCPLFMLLKKCDHHITAFSSVCYEALAFDVPTTIIHPTGRDLYKDYIDKGIFNYAMDGDVLLATIRKDYTEEQLKEASLYIETSRQCAEDALKIILSRTSQNRNVRSGSFVSYEEAVTNVHVINQLGVDFFKKGAVKEALNSFSRAVEINPNFAIAFSNLAVLYLQTGKKDKALQYFTKALELAPDNRNIVSNVIEFLKILGNMKAQGNMLLLF